MAMMRAFGWTSFLGHDGYAGFYLYVNCMNVSNAFLESHRRSAGVDQVCLAKRDGDVRRILHMR